ncbi:Plasma membrane ATPase [Wickerhamiella sorbophila]|uniref:Plasma membrane ATPase n=2 Tax=Opisthokonta TaxID=33154 RepID=A0A2T0FM45_9ASCO|nr:Plasma membrane ATPase [Wickerhamiella sorbophila]PRT56049.1 Plasma membrane ATPase [Wickerhamiella sorbophila]
MAEDKINEPVIDDTLEEYAGLVKFVATYRDEKDLAAERAANEEEEAAKPPPKWKFWKKVKKDGEVAGFQVPDSWVSTDLKTGLDSHEVEQRRKKAGYNELTSEHANIFLQILGYFSGPILYTMEVAVILAAGLRDWIDFGVIIGILMLNAGVGWYQEKQAADVVASLKADIAMRATVVRDGHEQEVLARDIVPGDIVVIEEGTVVPGDCRLICAYDNPQGFAEYLDYINSDLSAAGGEGDDEDEEDGEGDRGRKVGHSIIAVDQSSITGESLAVDKYMADMAYYTTGCKRGKAFAVVCSTGTSTFVGKTAAMVQGAQDQGHFKAIMNSIGTALLVLVAFWIMAAWIGGFFRGLNIATPEHSSNNLLHYMLILLIVGVPVGLPVVTTTTLAVGAAYLADKKAIVQKLTAIESLAGVDILCSDKTGTLTANKLSIRDPFLAEGVDVNWMMAVAALASSHNIKALDPIDKITILTLKRYPKALDIMQQGWKTISFTPFDPVSKRITAVCELNGETYTCAKGAPKAVLALTNCSPEQAQIYKDKAREFASRGFRSLGVAVKKGDEDWQLLGMISLFDPPRDDTAQTIVEAQQLGLSVKMLTGDAIAIAKETCKMLALGTKVYNSDKLVNGGLTGALQHDLVEKADGFAEVFPEHKYQVVEMLQERGHLTAMTGDGVNDAPSLKKSDCGIAVEGATEAAQAAADIVFIAPGLSTIVDSIKVARQIFQRMKAYIQYRIALCLHLEIYLVTSMIIINETVRVELVVFLALFADLATIAIAYDNAHYEPRPVEWQLPKIWIISSLLGLLLALATWVIRATMYIPSGGIVENYGSVQEVLFLQISLTENWLIFVTRGGQTYPSWELVAAILGVDVIATIFCLFGWLSGPGSTLDTNPHDLFEETTDGWTSIVTVVVIWGYSIMVTVVIAVAAYILNRLPGLADLGRSNRSNSDAKLENLIGRLSRLAIEHEHDEATGKSRFTIAPKTSSAEEMD